MNIPSKELQRREGNDFSLIDWTRLAAFYVVYTFQNLKRLWMGMASLPNKRKHNTHIWIGYMDEWSARAQSMAAGACPPKVSCVKHPSFLLSNIWQISWFVVVWCTNSGPTAKIFLKCCQELQSKSGTGNGYQESRHHYFILKSIQSDPEMGNLLLEFNTVGNLELKWVEVHYS